MLQKFKVSVGGVFNNPKTKVTFILIVATIMALVGSAPHQSGG
jgi:hypothetical protein